MTRHVKNVMKLALCAMTVALLSAGAPGQEQEKSDGWMELVGPEVQTHWRPERSGPGWSMAGDASMSAARPQALESTPGRDVMLRADPERKAPNLLTKQEFGDVELHVEFLIPQQSNSGVYLMGRYEVQVFDSYGKEADVHDCGAIYERWDPGRGKGREGFEGRAPRVNASRPPGQWQTFDILFRAPRFDASGDKIANAKFLKVIHNGTVVHEDVEVTGPTRAAKFADERPTGPLMVQGDHGPVAYRNVRIRAVTRD